MSFFRNSDSRVNDFGLEDMSVLIVVPVVVLGVVVAAFVLSLLLHRLAVQDHENVPLILIVLYGILDDVEEYQLVHHPVVFNIKIEFLLFQNKHLQVPAGYLGLERVDHSLYLLFDLL